MVAPLIKKQPVRPSEAERQGLTQPAKRQKKSSKLPVSLFFVEAAKLTPERGKYRKNHLNPAEDNHSPSQIMYLLLILMFLLIAKDVPCLSSFSFVPRGMFTSTINACHFKSLFATKDTYDLSTLTEVELKERLKEIEREKEEIERLIKSAKKAEKLEEKATKKEEKLEEKAAKKAKKISKEVENDEKIETASASPYVFFTGSAPMEPYDNLAETVESVPFIVSTESIPDSKLSIDNSLSDSIDDIMTPPNLPLMTGTPATSETLKSSVLDFSDVSSLVFNGNLKQSVGDGVGGAGITLTPASGVYSRVVVWCHGLGDSAPRWAEQISLEWESMLPHTKFILPIAPTRPLSLNNGFIRSDLCAGCPEKAGWFDIFALEEYANEDIAGIEEAASRIHDIIEAEINKNIEPGRILVGGFSQGGALALSASLRSRHALAGCVALSTWLPLKKKFPGAMHANARKLRVLQIHGTEDKIVSHEWGLSSHNFLKQGLCLPEPEFMTIEGLGHHSHPDGIKRMKDFMCRVLDNVCRERIIPQVDNQKQKGGANSDVE